MEAGRGAGLLPAGQPHGMRGYAQIQAEIALLRRRGALGWMTGRGKNLQKSLRRIARGLAESPWAMV